MRPVVTAVAEELYDSLGPWREVDGEETGWSLLLFCDAVAHDLQGMITVIRDQDDRPGWAIAVDPNLAPAEYLPWLGQFVGVKVDTYRTVEGQRSDVAARGGFARGSLGAVRRAAQTELQGTQFVDIDERDTSPYHLTVTFYRGEVKGRHYADVNTTYATYADLNAAFPTYADWTASAQNVIDALQAAKPAGLILDTIVLEGTP